MWRRYNIFFRMERFGATRAMGPRNPVSYVGGFGRFSVLRFCRFPYENRRVESCLSVGACSVLPSTRPSSPSSNLNDDELPSLPRRQPRPDRLSVDLAACCSLGEGGERDIELLPQLSCLEHAMSPRRNLRAGWRVPGFA